MNDEIVKMKRAKMYVDYLISGVDPIDNENIDSETFQNERVVACFKYISEVLERDIYNMENKTSRSHEIHTKSLGWELPTPLFFYQKKIKIAMAHQR